MTSELTKAALQALAVLDRVYTELLVDGIMPAFGLVQARKNLRTALTQPTAALHTAPTVPKGWKLVPEEPTPEILTRIYEAMKTLCSPKTAVDAWVAALAVAPASPVNTPPEPPCSYGCTTECLAQLHGCTSECPALPRRPPFGKVTPGHSPGTESASEWVSVADRLPDDEVGSGAVEFYNSDLRNPTRQVIGIYREGCWYSGGHVFVNVSHWKPLTPAPVDDLPEL